VVLGLAASAVDILVETAGVAGLEIGDDQARVDAVWPGFGSRDHALDAAPALRAVEEFRIAPRLAALRTPIGALRRAEAQAQLVEATPIDSPDVAVFGRQEHNRQYSTDPSQQVTDQRTDATTVGVHVRIPLPTHGRQAPRRAEALAEMTRAAADYEKAKRVVLADIAAARANLAAARRAAGLADKRLAVANEQFELSRKSFALGEIGGLDFYRIRQLQLDAQRAQAAGSVVVGAAVSRLNQAQGYAP
jgi:cobalt-zinc-cadmium efflux system outer membrane protein